MTPEERFERIERNLDTLTTMTIQRADRMSEFDLAMDKLASAQRRLLTAQVVLTGEVTKLAAAQRQTGERLNILIDAVMKREKP